jgi:putative nucleotidyltransferase with HDIG domain
MSDEEINQILGMLQETVPEVRSQEKPNHVKRVTAYTLAICRAMGIPRREIEAIARGAYLHDIGKMAIPVTLLIKPGPLTPEETATMREHCARGYSMVNKIPMLQGVPAEIVHSHHENYDGTGYPRGLKGNEIPLGARIVAVANTLDSITMNLPYRPARTRDDARAEIKLWSGRQFDPDVVNVFLSMPDAIWPQLVESLH